MIAVLHFRGHSNPPVGIWWVEDDSAAYAHSYYVEGEELAHNAGRIVMSNKLPDVSWLSFFDHLTEQLPYFNIWMLSALEDNVDPSKYLNMMIKEAKKTLSADN